MRGSDLPWRSASSLDWSVAGESEKRLITAERPESVLSAYPACSANAVGRLLLATFAGPIRFWLPLAVATLIAAGVGYSNGLSAELLTNQALES